MTISDNLKTIEAALKVFAGLRQIADDQQIVMSYQFYRDLADKADAALDAFFVPCPTCKGDEVITAHDLCDEPSCSCTKPCPDCKGEGRISIVSVVEKGFGLLRRLDSLDAAEGMQPWEGEKIGQRRIAVMIELHALLKLTGGTS